MTEDAFPRLLRIERRSMSYRLPPGTDVLVRAGQTVGPDALLARVPRMPLIEPYAADLGASPADATTALTVRDGNRVRGGEQLARRRSGWRTHVLTAVTNGIVSVRPEVGVYLLAPVVPTEVVSRYGGTVHSVAPDEIRVTSTIECLRCSLVSPQTAAEGALHALEDPRTLPPDTPLDVVLVPHLADFSPLRAMARAGATLVIAGTVADAVAWELLTAQTRAPHVATVAGPGEAAEGWSIFAAVRSWHNREVWFENLNGSPALCTEARSSLLPTDASPATITLRDPAHWGQSATIVPAMGEEMTMGGITRTVMLSGTGQMVIPSQNGGPIVDEPYE